MPGRRWSPSKQLVSSFRNPKASKAATPAAVMRSHMAMLLATFKEEHHGRGPEGQSGVKCRGLGGVALTE
jgi:hypothetical protein